MKKILYTVFLLLALQTFSQAQTWRRIGGWGNDLSGVVWVNEQVGYISGNQIILKTIDGGLSWTEQQAPNDNRMLGIDFFDENLGLIVGEQGQIFRTSDGGNNWQILNINSNVRLNKVKFLSQTRAYAVGENGEVYRSINSGQTWARQAVGITEELRGLNFTDADTGYVAAADGRVLRTYNGGNNWTILSTGQSNALNDVYFVNGRTGYAVGERGTLLKTTDSGATWVDLNSGTERNLLAVAFNRNNINIGVITGSNGTVIRTTNGGMTLDGINLNNAENYGSVAFRTNSNIVFAVAGNGFVISSTNSGQSWTLRLSGRNINYTGTQFRTNLLGYIIGENGRFFVTTNGGTSLTDRSRPLSVKLNDLAFTTNAFGYIAGEQGNLLRTANSGVNWTSLNLQSNNNLNGLFFFNNTTGYVVGSGGLIARTSDSGVNWSTANTGIGNVNLKDLLFFKTDTGIVIGERGFIAFTENGNSWTSVTTGSTEDLKGIKTLDDSTAIVVGNRGTILKTSNKGKNWEKISVEFTQNLNAVDFLDESVGFIAGDRGLILQTKDAGKTWIRMPTGTFQDFSGLSFGDLSVGYAVGENGTLFGYSCQAPETPTVIFGETNICLSQQVYTIQPSVDPEERFEWRVDGGTILEGQGTNRIVVRWDTPGRNAVLVRGQNFCGNGGTRGLEVVVSTQPQVIPEIIGEGAVCINTSIEYNVNEIPGTIYIWQTSGGDIIAGQGTAKVTVRWTAANQRTLTVTPSNPCGTGQAFTKPINVQSPPEQSSEITGPTIAALTTEEYSVTNVPNVNYQWNIEGGTGGRIISGQGTNRIQVAWEREGNFIVKVTPMNFCNNGPERLLNVNVNLITSIIRGEETGGVQINAYPNPSTGDFNLTTLGLSNIQQIRIINSLGQVIQEIEPLEGITDFRFSGLPRGIFSILIRTREKEYVKKLMVQ